MNLPCDKCKSECCMAAPVGQDDLDRLQEYLERQTESDIWRMADQIRKPGKCPFVDMTTHRCFIYEARPQVCRYFGLTPRLVCSYKPEMADTILDIEAAPAILGQVIRDQHYAVLGIDIGWPELIPEEEYLRIGRKHPGQRGKHGRINNALRVLHSGR